MIATVEVLVEAGEITPRQRATVDDLEFAATWLDAYEGDPEDDPEILVAAATVARWLRREVDRRLAR